MVETFPAALGTTGHAEGRRVTLDGAWVVSREGGRLMVEVWSERLRHELEIPAANLPCAPQEALYRDYPAQIGFEVVDGLDARGYRLMRGKAL